MYNMQKSTVRKSEGPKVLKKTEGSTQVGMRWGAAVTKFNVNVRKPNATDELEELFGIGELPLSEAEATVELRGVPTAVVNALRRVVTDEMVGYALKVSENGFKAERTTELYMLPQFVNQRIELMPLLQRPAAEAAARNLRIELNMTNTSASAITVYAGDLRVVSGQISEPIFNPTFEIATLQPGKCIVIEDIIISSGRGRDNAMFQVACCTSFRHLDIPQYTDDEMRLSSGAAADLSGYKTSCLVSDPRWHELRLTLPVTGMDPKGDVRSALEGACENIRARLRLVIAALEEPSGSTAPAGSMQFTVVSLEGGLVEAVLYAPGETHTIGELMRRAIFDVAPDVSYATYSLSAHEKRMVITVRQLGVESEITAIFAEAAQMAIATFDDIALALGPSPSQGVVANKYTDLPGRGGK